MNDNQPSDDVTRAMPHALGPEKSVLSSCLKDPLEFMARAIEAKLSEDHFYMPSHATLYGQLLELYAAGEEIELVSLIQRLLDRGLLDRCGGPSAITDIYGYALSNGSWDWHLKHVKDKAILRGIIRVSNESIADAYETPDDAAGALDRAEGSLAAIRAETDSSAERTVKHAVGWVLEDLQIRLSGKTATGIKTGYEELDAMTGGIKPGELFVIAARPSMGKTSLMTNIAESVCMDGGVPTLVFSCEMTTEQLIQRVVYSRARFNFASLSRGHQPDKGELQRIQRNAIEVAKAKLFVDDTPGITINQIRAKARRQHREKGVRFVAIDYLQLLRSNTKQAANSREREIAEISAGLKGLAKEIGIPILVLAQLNRQADNRTGKSMGVPRMSDLRESGAIEQDADLVGLLTRPEYYAETDEDKEKLAGVATLNLAKNRNGETGLVHLTWIAPLMRFESGQPQAREYAAKKTEYAEF